VHARARARAQIRGLFTDTNIYLLCVTMAVATVHLLLDVLAFKNDISFWRERKDMVGLSLRTQVWHCISHTVIAGTCARVCVCSVVQCTCGMKAPVCWYSYLPRLAQSLSTGS